MGENKTLKDQRLKSRTQIRLLFEESEALSKYPLRFLIRKEGNSKEPGLEVMFAVPKRKLKKAHDRNRMKRLLREAFRLNKQNLETLVIEKDIRYRIGIIFTVNKLCGFDTIQGSMRYLLSKLEKEIGEDTL